MTGAVATAAIDVNVDILLARMRRFRTTLTSNFKFESM